MVRRSAEIIASAELLVVAAISPALLFPNPRRLLVLVVVPLIWFCAWLATGRALPRTPLNSALWILLTMVAVSLYATFDVQFSLGKVSGVILGVLLFWAVNRWITTGERLAVSLAAFLAAGGVLAIIGLLGSNWFDKFPVLGAIARHLPRAIRGVPGAEEGFQPNAVAGCLVLFVPLQAALLVEREHRWMGSARSRKLENLMQALLLVLTTGTLMLTQSRGAWVGLLVATLAFLTWHSRRTRKLAAIVAGTALTLAVVLGPERVVNATINRSGPGMAADVSGRVELWSRALYGIQDFPFTGMGMNTFRKVMPVLYPTFLTSPDVDVSHAHNHLLQAALDLGLPGLVAYVSIWMVTCVLLMTVYRRSGERLYRAAASGLGAGLIAHFVFSMTDAIPLGAKVGVLFWLTLSLAVALHRTALARQPLKG
jgi:putative inorganic carbon (HCO3(-)) transporter